MGGRRLKTLTRRQFAAGAFIASAGIALHPAQALALLAWEERRSESGRKILILGAGAAGLAAGLKLKEMGHEVAILEARSRPGAGRIPSTHALTLAYIERFKLALDPFYPESGAEVFLWRGKRLIVPAGGSPDLNQLEVNFTARERDVGFAGLSKLYLERVREEVRAWPAEAWPYLDDDRYKQISYGEFLRDQGASPDAIAYLAQGFEEDSLLDYAHDAVSHSVPKLWKIRGGNDLLSRAMAAQLAQQIRYGAEVVRIEQDSKDVRVIYAAGGTQYVETAERVICTIPFPVLRDIEVAPGFGAGKAKAIRELYLGPVSRVFVQVRTRSWERQGLNGFATVDQPMEFWCPTHNQPGTRGILMSYIYERLAGEYSAQTPEAQIARSLDLFERIHPGTRAQFESATTWSWLNERYSRGAYLVTKPGQFELLRHTGTPEGRVHFAGEHASPWPGWIQGALHSGLRAAREVNEAG